MTSIRKLRQRHQRWCRYMTKVLPAKATRAVRDGIDYPPGYARTETAVWRLRDQRNPIVFSCVLCGLADLHRGQGDGIGSCDCPRCDWCWAGPGECDCGWAEEYEDDEPAMRIEDERAFQEAGAAVIQHRVCGGIFTADPDVPPDHNGRRTCVCHLVGGPGDTHHTVPEPVEDGRMRAAGERGDG